MTAVHRGRTRLKGRSLTMRDVQDISQDEVVQAQEYSERGLPSKRWASSAAEESSQVVVVDFAARRRAA